MEPAAGATPDGSTSPAQVSLDTAAPSVADDVVVPRWPSPIRDQPVAPPWPSGLTRAIDSVAALVAVALAVVVAVDAALPGRPVLALVFFLFVPGWATLRSFRTPGSSFVAFGAVGASVATTLLLGQVLVTSTDWAWQEATVAAAIACALALLRVIVRP